jgi:hypothetical protein
VHHETLDLFQFLLDNGADYLIPDDCNETVDEYVEKYKQEPFKSNLLLNFN